jgi:hypothetical protein
MKKSLCFVAFLVLAAQLPLWCYDTSPSSPQIIPEAIWAQATGGGTWVTELQITNFAATAADISVYFLCAGEIRGWFLLHSGLVQHHSVRFSNILATIDSLDPDAGFSYYGRVGALYLQASSMAIQAQAKTLNGNYGKTFPGLSNVAGNTAAQGRPMIIQDLVQNATYRTSVGVFNSYEEDLTATFTIIDAANGIVGSPFSKTLSGMGFISFNPFAQAGVPSGTYENCWLHIEVTGGDPEATLMCYGSIANNLTNDTYALIAKQYGPGGSPAPLLPIRR